MLTIASTADLTGKDCRAVKVTGVGTIHDLGRHRSGSMLAGGSEPPANKLSYSKLDDDSAVRLGARLESEHALARRRVPPTDTFEEARPPQQPPQQPDHVAPPNAKPPLVPVTASRPASV